MDLKEEYIPGGVHGEPLVKPDVDLKEEYTPAGEEHSGNPYVPGSAAPEKDSEYVPEGAGDDGDDQGYTPCLSMIEQSYVSTYRATDAVAAVNSVESGDSSDSDGSEIEFTPMPETQKLKNALTEEEKNSSFPIAKFDLQPAQLPPLPDVSGIIVPPQITMLPCGVIERIIPSPIVLVVVQSVEGSKTLADESLVFRTDRTPVGLVFETFGPVKRPFYSVRFTDMHAVDEFKLKIGDQLYYAPDFAEFVQTDMLLREKGCDASWKDDEECPLKYRDYSDDENEQNQNKAAKEKRKLAKAEATGEPPPSKKQKQHDPNSTLYICGLPTEYKEGQIKELMQSFGVKRVRLLRLPNGESKCSAIVNCSSSQNAQAAITRLNMNITLPGCNFPLAVKLFEQRRDGAQQRPRPSGDLDRPTDDGASYRVTFQSNKSTIVSGSYVVGAEAREKKTSTQHTLHTLQPDYDGVIGVDHAFVKKYDQTMFANDQPRASVVLTGSNPKSKSTDKVEDDDDVFGWGASISSSTRPFYGQRALPPELANPAAHPSPYEDPSQKKQDMMSDKRTDSVDARRLPRGLPLTGMSGSIVAAAYDSASDDDMSDPENPTFMSFCDGSKSKVCPIERRGSSTATPSDARRDFTVLNSLFGRAVNKAPPK